MVTAYYENAGMLRAQAEMLWRWPPEVREQWAWNIVDDGSPRSPAVCPHVSGVRLSLYRCKVDVPWNQDFCRNLGVDRAKTDWVLLTDMDHLVPAVTAMALCAGKFDKRLAYRFARVSAPGLRPYHPHPNSWLMTRSLFWAAGGYDENLAGHYGTDGDFLSRVRRHTSIVALPHILIRVPREVIPDASTTTYPRKTEAGALALRQVRDDVKRRRLEPLHLSFPWDQIA